MHRDNSAMHHFECGACSLCKFSHSPESNGFNGKWQEPRQVPIGKLERGESGRAVDAQVQRELDKQDFLTPSLFGQGRL